MSEPKKQHYVPQTYLRGFSISDKAPQKIYVLHKSIRKIFCVSICDTASEKHFYTVRKLRNQYVWETTYANTIEPLMSHVLSQILSKCGNVLIQDHALVLTPEMKKQLAITMVCQLLRGKQSREFERKLYSETVPNIIEDAKMRFAPIDEHKESILKAAMEDDEYFKLASLQATLDIPRIEKLSSILLQRSFLVFRIIGELEFLTSDNPVMFMDSISLNASPFRNGLAKSTTVVFYPISPKLLIASYPPNLYFGTLSEFDSQLIFINSNKEKAFINTINQKQIEQCFNQVYARTKETIELYNH